jgi:HEPN domain-containing protein
MPILLNWLESFDRRMALEEVPHRARPIRAWCEWCRETGESFGIEDPKAKQIFQWFELHSPPGALYVPSVFTGAFYFDAYFWPVDIPMVFGTQALESRDTLAGMPATTQRRLFEAPDDLEDFKALWADCIDYGHGYRDLHLEFGATEFWQRMIVSADRKLRSAVEDLCKPSPGENAMQSSREACEMALKGLLARDHSLTEDDAKNPKKFYHDLSKLLEAVLHVAPNQIFSEAKARLCVFPSVGDRYAAKPYRSSDLWASYKIAQAIAAEVMRAFTPRNTRKQIATRF